MSWPLQPSLRERLRLERLRLPWLRERRPPQPWLRERLRERLRLERLRRLWPLRPLRPLRPERLLRRDRLERCRERLRLVTGAGSALALAFFLPEAASWTPNIKS